MVISRENMMPFLQEKQVHMQARQKKLNYNYLVFTQVECSSEEIVLYFPMNWPSSMFICYGDFRKIF